MYFHVFAMFASRFQPVGWRERVAGLTVRVRRIPGGLGDEQIVVGFPSRLPPGLVRLAFARMPRIGHPELLELERVCLVGSFVGPLGLRGGLGVRIFVRKSFLVIGYWFLVKRHGRDTRIVPLRPPLATFLIPFLLLGLLDLLRAVLIFQIITDYVPAFGGLAGFEQQTGGHEVAHVLIRGVEHVQQLVLVDAAVRRVVGTPADRHDVQQCRRRVLPT